MCSDSYYRSIPTAEGILPNKADTSDPMNRKILSMNRSTSCSLTSRMKSWLGWSNQGAQLLEHGRMKSNDFSKSSRTDYYSESSDYKFYFLVVLS